MDKFWKTYRTISLYLIFPAICMFVIGMFSHMLDQDPERFDRQTQGVVVSCVDKTDRSRATRENGGFMLVFQIKAEYQVDGVTYNSAKPSDSTLNTDPVAGKKRVDELVVGSGIALLFCVVPLAAEKIRKPKKKT